MLHLDDAVYKESKQIALGQIPMDPMVAEMAAWFLERFAVQILNLQFSKLTGPGTDRYRLYVVIAKHEDFGKMYRSVFEPIEDYQNQVAAEFQRVAPKYGFGAPQQFENLFVIYNDFSDEAKTEANWKASDEVKQAIKAKYPTVWEVLTPFSNIIFFYCSDAEVAINEENGTSASIANDYYTILKKYDDLNYFTRQNIDVRFDSKENLDKNYEGNFFYYSR